MENLQLALTIHVANKLYIYYHKANNPELTVLILTYSL